MKEYLEGGRRRLLQLVVKYLREMTPWYVDSTEKKEKGGGDSSGAST